MPDMAEQSRRAEVFAELHRRPEPFVVANPWNAGTAKILAGLGFPALATTGAGLAYALGLPDGEVGREEVLANAAEIIAATELPVSADLENRYGDSPQEVAETIRLAAAAGLVGGSIEDATGRSDTPVYELELAVERVAAAVAAAEELPFEFTVTARAENFFVGVPDLPDTIRRLRAFAEAGAHVVYAPALPDVDAIRVVCSAVDVPVNVLAAGAAARLSVAELGALGVRRISLGSALPRAALTATLAAAREVATSGTFGFTAGALSYPEINELMRKP